MISLFLLDLLLLFPNSSKFIVLILYFAEIMWFSIKLYRILHCDLSSRHVSVLPPIESGAIEHKMPQGRQEVFTAGHLLLLVSVTQERGVHPCRRVRARSGMKLSCGTQAGVQMQSFPWASDLSKVWPHQAGNACSHDQEANQLPSLHKQPRFL